MAHGKRRGWFDLTIRPRHVSVEHAADGDGWWVSYDDHTTVLLTNEQALFIHAQVDQMVGHTGLDPLTMRPIALRAS